MRELKEFTGSQAQDKQSDLIEAFPEIGDVPEAPFNSLYCHLPQVPPPMVDPLRLFLKRYLPRRWTYTTQEIIDHNDEFLKRKAPQHISPLVDKLARFLIAFSSGAALVVPMAIMRLHQNTNKSLITTSIAVLLFASALSVGLKVSNETTMVATSTYAAVLVVFVGTSG